MKRFIVLSVLLLLSSIALAQAVAPPSTPPTNSLMTEPVTPPAPAPDPAPAPAPSKDAAPKTDPAPAPAQPSATPAPSPNGKTTAHLFRGAKIYIAPIEGGYDIYLTAAIQKKQVPVVIITDRAKADFEIAGVTETEKAGWAKMLFLGSEASNEQASIKVADLKSGEIVFGYNVNKRNSVRGKQSSSEACAKHMKENIEEASK